MAQPKPKNISWACHWMPVKAAAGASMTPANISVHSTGRLRPERQASAKKGRKPTSQSGWFIAYLGSIRR